MKETYAVNNKLVEKNELSDQEKAMAAKHEELKAFCMNKADELGIDMIMFSYEDFEEDRPPMVTLGLNGHIPSLLQAVDMALSSPASQESLMHTFIQQMGKVADHYGKEEQEGVALEAASGVVAIEMFLQKYQQ